MNTYFAAILKATDNGKFPELTDCWRNYHPEAILSDSDHLEMTEREAFPLPSYLTSIYF